MSAAPARPLLDAMRLRAMAVSTGFAPPSNAGFSVVGKNTSGPGRVARAIAAITDASRTTLSAFRQAGDSSRPFGKMKASRNAWNEAAGKRTAPPAQLTQECHDPA